MFMCWKVNVLKMNVLKNAKDMKWSWPTFVLKYSGDPEWSSTQSWLGGRYEHFIQPGARH